MPSPPESRSTALSRYPNVAVIGAGVIGSSWAALFLAHGLKVVVNDPRPDIEAVVKADLERFAPTLRALGLAADGLARIRASSRTSSAPLPMQMWSRRTVRNASRSSRTCGCASSVRPRSDALLLSSSSTRTATEQARDMVDASRMLIGHPFNPPHLIPLVEVVPGERTEPKAVEEAMAFYEALGKVPRTLRKESRLRRQPVAAGHLPRGLLPCSGRSSQRRRAR